MKENRSFFRIIELSDAGATVREPDSDEIITLAKNVITSRLQRDDAISEPSEARDYLIMQLGLREQEVFGCLFLDNRHRVINFDVLFYGSIDGASVHPREVVKRALIYNAAAVILAHNHPSGISEPSKADEAITTRLIDALRLIDVRVLDHLIVGGGDATSLAERGLM